MGMKLAKIRYHLERAAIARADHAAGRPVNMGSLRYGSHLDRAAMHDDRAAEYLADGLRQYASLSTVKRSVYQRNFVRKKYAGGPGRGHRGPSGYVSAGGKGFVKK